MMGPLTSILRDKNDGKQLTQYLAVFSATIALFTSGIYQTWGSPSLVKILSDEYPIDVSEEEASYIIVIGSVGHVIAGFLASLSADRIGRKNTIVGIGIPQLLSFVLIALSYRNKSLLYVARVLGGMGEGASIALVPCYIAEIAEPTVRGSLCSFVSLTMTAGGLFITVIGSFLTIKTAALVCLIFPTLLWLTFINMPESPYYCLMKNDLKGAKISLQMLRRKKNVDKEIIQLAVDVERQMSEKGSFKDLFTIDSNRKAFFTVIAMRFFQIFSGPSAFSSYNQIMISQSTDFSPVLGSCIFLIGNLSMLVLTSWYIDKVGRKPMFVVSSGLVVLTLYSQAIFLTLRDYTSIDTTPCSWLPFLIIFLYYIALSGGLGPGVNVYTGEFFSARIKAKAMSACSFFLALTNIGSIKLYQYTADNIGLSVPFYIFATNTAVGTLFFAFVIPETKGKTLETIQQELKGIRNNI